MKIIEVAYDWAGPLVRRTRTELLIVHQSGGEAQAGQLHELHRARGWVGIGYHYYIRRDGQIYRGRPEACVGAHAAGDNERSIGLCFEGDFEREKMGAAQLSAGAALIADIWRRNGRLGAVRHREKEDGGCPGRLFPLEDMLALASLRLRYGGE